MLISKTKFINFLRCRNFCALHEIKLKKEAAVVSFDEDNELNEIMNYENTAKKQALFSDIESVSEEDSDVDKKRLETLMPYYKKIEELTFKRIKSLFGGHIIYNENTYEQKRIKAEIDGYKYYAFLDCYQEDEKKIRIIESKATTSKKFKELAFRPDKFPMPVFIKGNDNTLILNPDYPLDKINEKFYNPYTDIGRYFYDIAYQCAVFEESNPKKKIEYYLSVLNDEYIYDGKTDTDLNPIYPDSIITLINVTPILDFIRNKVYLDIERVNSYLDEMDANTDHIRIGKYCEIKKTHQCEFYSLCGKVIKKIPEKNSIFTYMNNDKGFDKHGIYDLINEHYVKATDIPKEWLTRQNNIIQREVIENNIPYVDKVRMKDALETIKYPVYYLDFESFPCPLPRLKGEKPYSQSLFQFSVHIEREPFICDKDKDNYYFLSEGITDDREELIRKMIETIKPDGGTVIVYNESFEKTRIKELINLYPEYKKELEDILSRIFDLMYVLKGNKTMFENLGFKSESKVNYYHTDLNGSYSIKKVLPVFSDLSYKDLAIQNGVFAYTTYALFGKMNAEQKKFDFFNLLEYCKQDTYSMVLILWEIKRLIAQNNLLFT